MEYPFSLKFKLPANLTDLDTVVGRLGEHGCSDALVGLGQPGYVGLDFVREADNAQSALRSGIDNVTRALPGAQRRDG